jgi:hypothetical protein
MGRGGDVGPTMGKEGGGSMLIGDMGTEGDLVNNRGGGEDLGIATKCGVRTIAGVRTTVSEVVHRIKIVAGLANSNCGTRREIDPKALVLAPV